MGGPGSGRIADPVKALQEQREAIAVQNNGEGFYIPNLSPVKQGGKLLIDPNAWFAYENGELRLYVNGAVKASWS